MLMGSVEKVAAEEGLAHQAHQDGLAPVATSVHSTQPEPVEVRNVARIPFVGDYDAVKASDSARTALVLTGAATPGSLGSARARGARSHPRTADRRGVSERLVWPRKATIGPGPTARLPRSHCALDPWFGVQRRALAREPAWQGKSLAWRSPQARLAFGTQSVSRRVVAVWAELRRWSRPPAPLHAAARREWAAKKDRHHGQPARCPRKSAG